MKTTSVSMLICLCFLGLVGVAFAQTKGQSASQQSTIDCSNVGIDFMDDPNMTREERLEAMDRALQKSLGLYDLCQDMVVSEGVAGSVSAGGGGMSGESSVGESGECSSATSGKGAAKDGSSTSGEMAKADSSRETGDGASVSSDMEYQADDHELAEGTAKGAPVSSVATSDIQGSGSRRGSSVQAGHREDSSTMSGTEGKEQPGDLNAAEDNSPVGGSQEALSQTSAGAQGAVPEDVKEADNDSILEAQIREAAMREKDPEVRARLWNEYRRYKGLPQK